MCHLCSKTFLHRSSFNLHIKTHGDIRPHKCHICEKAFLQKAKLAVHMQSHTGERPVILQLFLVVVGKHKFATSQTIISTGQMSSL